MTVVIGILAFLVVLTVLVAAHEYGHYLFARLYGMEVEEFAIGMGPKPWTIMQRGGTKFTIRPLPLGGFVRVKGMVPEEDGSEVNVDNGFYSRGPFARIVIFLAGPVFSAVFGWLTIFLVLWAVGTPDESRPKVGRMLKDSAAFKAGLKEGDRFISIDGRPVIGWMTVVESVRDKAGQQISIVVRRGTKEQTILVTPVADAEPSDVLGEFGPTGEKRIQGKIGVMPDFDLVHGAGPAFGSANDRVRESLQGFASIFRKPQQAKEQVGGPIAIVGAATQSAQAGVSSLIFFAGMLSISLGILNMLPIYPFDGGQLLLALIELVRGRRLSFRVQNVVAGVGLFFVLTLFAAVFVIDIGRLNAPKQPQPEFAKDK